MKKIKRDCHIPPCFGTVLTENLDFFQSLIFSPHESQVDIGLLFRRKMSLQPTAFSIWQRHAANLLVCQKTVCPVVEPMLLEATVWWHYLAAKVTGERGNSNCCHIQKMRGQRELTIVAVCTFAYTSGKHP